VRRITEGSVELTERVFHCGTRVHEAGGPEALCDLRERDAFGGQDAAAILERFQGFRSPGTVTGAGSTGGAAGGGAEDVGGGNTGGAISGAVTVAGSIMGGVAAAGVPDFPGGSLSAPLMPQETIAKAASGTMIAMAKRRNIRLLELYALDVRNAMYGAIDEQFITRRGGDCMSTESEFVALTDAVLQSIGKALDAASDNSDADIDWSLNDGILTIDCGAGGKMIVNRHAPNRELWVAAKAGGFHFRIAAGAWSDTRSGEGLPMLLSRLLQTQSGIQIAFALPDPA
jgi:CyaY protein